MTDHRQTAKTLLALANTLGPQRHFLSKIVQTGRPTASQLQWLERVASRVDTKLGEVRHAA